MDKATFMLPSTALVHRLNRLFIESHAAAIAVQLPDSELPAFAELLRDLGVLTQDLCKPGLERVLELIDPEGAVARKFDDLPPPAHSFLNCRPLRDWAFSPPLEVAKVPKAVTCLGTGPFDGNDFESFLKQSGVREIPLDFWGECIVDIYPEIRNSTDSRERWNRIAVGLPGVFPEIPESSDGTDIRFPPVQHVILGRDEWDAEQVDFAIDQHSGRFLRLYSQEMFVAYLLTRRNPFMAPREVLFAFRAGHPGLEFVSRGWGGWVDGIVPADKAERNNPISADFLRNVSPLKLLGYTVGLSGVDDAHRHQILANAFERELPYVGDDVYMQKWGDPKTPDRLRRIAEQIARSCALYENRRISESPEAIGDWKRDLQWLRETYYHGHFTFQWPDSENCGQYYYVNLAEP